MTPINILYSNTFEIVSVLLRAVLTFTQSNRLPSHAIRPVYEWPSIKPFLDIKTLSSYGETYFKDNMVARPSLQWEFLYW